MDNQQVHEWVNKTERLLGEIELLADPKARNSAVAAIQSLLELYGEALARMLQSSQRLGGKRLVEAYVEDELVSHLLLLHDLHPTDLHSRVRQALEEVQPYLQSHGGSIELLKIDGDIVRLKLLNTGHGCGNVAVTLKTALEQAIYDKAPDVSAVEIQDMTQPAGSFISVDSLLQGVK